MQVTKTQIVYNLILLAQLIVHELNEKVHLRNMKNV